jgi:hydroxypyruvate isomerase
MRFSANLGFLWADRPLPAAVRAAEAAGFEAVELHWPHDTPPEDLRAALEETALPCLSLNTARDAGSALGAVPGREAEAREQIDAAIAYARAVDARAVHVMAGVAEGAAAEAAFRGALAHACDAAGDLTVLIEPLNARDAPGYLLRTTGQAAALIAELGRPNLKLMFDCYHVQITEGDLTRRFGDLRSIIGHVQFAGVPGRGSPEEGEVAYDRLLPSLRWDGYFGAEYKPSGDTDGSLGWL